jgi:hypothetical protein
MSDEPQGRSRRKLRDVDSGNVGIRVKAFAWSLVATLPIALIGAHFASGTRYPLLVTIAVTVGGFLLLYAGSLALGEVAGRTAGSLFFSSGSSTPSRREYSLADSLIVRGRLDDAISELERASALYAADAEPPLRLARLLRDACARPQDSIRWFRTAADRSGGDAGIEIAALRELIEVHTHVLRTPRGALPHMARLASRHPDTPAGAWARREMAELKQSMQEEERE